MIRPNTKALGITIAVGLAVVLFIALSLSLPTQTPALTNAVRLVDGAGGADAGTCTATPCASIGYALSQTANGDEIHVAQGTYVEVFDINTSVNLRGGYESAGWTRDIENQATILQGDGSDRAVIDIVPGSDVLIEGFTIEGGRNLSDSGGGLFVNGSTLVISGTVVRDNQAGGSGGGMYAEGDVPLSVINSTFISNTATGAGALDLAGGTGHALVHNTLIKENTGWHAANFNGRSFEMVSCQVISNTDTGDGAVEIDSDGLISNTEFLSHTSRAILTYGGEITAHGLTVRNGTGGGIVNGGMFTLTDSLLEGNSGGDWPLVASENNASPEGVSLVVEGCTIRGSRDVPVIVGATQGDIVIRDTAIVDNASAVTDSHVIGLAPEAGDAELVNVLVANNSSVFPVIHATNASATTELVNVTVAGNEVSGEDAHVLVALGPLTVINSIVWDKSEVTATIQAGTADVSFSDIEGGWATGSGNRDIAPGFVNPLAGDYHLGSWSYLIDAGTSTPAKVPDHDLEGNLRPLDGNGDGTVQVDMGAYEAGFVPGGPTITSVSPNQGRNHLPNEIFIEGTGFESGARVGLEQSSVTSGSGVGTHSASVEVFGLTTFYHSDELLSAYVPYHWPSGRYRLLVRNPDGGFAMKDNAYQVIPKDAVDLFAWAGSLWFEPPLLVAGKTAKVGLEVYYQGGTQPLTDVTVRFYSGHPGGTPIGDGIIEELAPWSHASTTGVDYLVPSSRVGTIQSGSGVVYARIDPVFAVDEYRNNNMVSRGVYFQVPTSHVVSGDTWRPQVDRLGINCAPGQWICSNKPGSRLITLSVKASEDATATPQSGVKSIYAAEEWYVESEWRWVLGATTDGWLPYEETVTCDPESWCNYPSWASIPLELVPVYGAHRVRVWVADGAGNVSDYALSTINLQPYHTGLANNSIQAPSPARLVEGMSHFYIYPITASHTVTAVLTPSSGDPDLYVWSPDASQSWLSLEGTGEVDEVSFVAPQTGYYVMQIHGYADAEYAFDTGSSESGLMSVSGGANPEAKAPLEEPGLPPEQVSEEAPTLGLPAPPVVQPTAFLPLVLRNH